MNCVHTNVNVQYMYVVCNIKVLCEDNKVVYIDVYRVAFKLNMYARAVVTHSHKSSLSWVFILTCDSKIGWVVKLLSYFSFI